MTVVPKSAPRSATQAPLKSRPVRAPAPHKPNLLERGLEHMGRSIHRATLNSGAFLKRASYVCFIAILAIGLGWFVWLVLFMAGALNSYFADQATVVVQTADGLETMSMAGMATDQDFAESLRFALVAANAKVMDVQTHVLPVIGSGLVAVIVTAIGLRKLH